MGPEALAQVLRPLQNMFRAEQYPQLLVGLEVSDDAAVYKINDEVAVIQTLDFLSPRSCAVERRRSLRRGACWPAATRWTTRNPSTAWR
jgi:hypothetical protein